MGESILLLPLYAFMRVKGITLIRSLQLQNLCDFGGFGESNYEYDSVMKSAATYLHMYC